jgi:hypothetical protein
MVVLDDCPGIVEVNILILEKGFFLLQVVAARATHIATLGHRNHQVYRQCWVQMAACINRADIDHRLPACQEYLTHILSLII